MSREMTSDSQGNHPAEEEQLQADEQRSYGTFRSSPKNVDAAIDNRCMNFYEHDYATCENARKVAIDKRKKISQSELNFMSVLMYR